MPHLLKAQEDNLNEADTLQRVIKVFEDVLGYDMLSDISREMEVKWKYVDLTLKIEGITKFFVEAKRARAPLRDRFVEQGELYAAEANIPWVVLTNGVEWKLFHLTFDEGVDFEPVFSVNLAADPIERSADLLSLLHRQAIKEGAHEEFWKRQAAMTADSIGKAIFNEDVLLFIRREIRRHEGTLIVLEDLAAAIYSLFTEEARVKIGPLKIRAKKLAKHSDAKIQAAPAAPPVSEAQLACGAPAVPRPPSQPPSQPSPQLGDQPRAAASV